MQTEWRFIPSKNEKPTKADAAVRKTRRGSPTITGKAPKKRATPAPTPSRILRKRLRIQVAFLKHIKFTSHS